jgi:hypothetical protein
MNASELMTFGQFVGAWTLEGWIEHPDGTRSEHRGEWHFDWALDGQAIQDVLVSPPPAERRDGEPWIEYGTTIRFYDPAAETWQITWITPVQRAVRRLSGGRRGERIVLEGRDAAGHLLRWSFNDIRPDSFVWRGEVSHDGGASWRLVEEMRLRRRADDRQAARSISSIR